MGRTPMKEEERDRTRARILDAAEVVFRRDGFKNARIDAIAAEAGLSAGTLYNYFSNKTELLLDQHQRSLDRAAPQVEALVRGPGTFPEKLDRYLEGFFRFGNENWILVGILRDSPELLRLSPRSVEDQAGRMKRLVERHVELAVNLLQAGIAEGTLVAEDPRMLALALLGMAKSVALMQVEGPEPGGIDGVALVRRLFLEGARRRAPG